jgi:hypothetical protein
MMRAFAIFLALLVPTGQALAVMHLHCALEHPPGRGTGHAAGYHEFMNPSDGTRSADEYGKQHVHGSAGEHNHADESRAPRLFDERHHHHDGLTSSHAGCCIGGSAGAMICDAGFASVGLDAERFELAVPSSAYDSPIQEPPQRPQWRAHKPA